MTDITEQEVERPGIDRRTLIKRTAAAGAVAWAAPTIIGSLTSPAGAVTGGFPATCSYMTLVVQCGATICAVKVIQGQTTCTLTNQTSSDATFSFTCPDGHVYTNNNAGTNNPISRDGTIVAACSGACPVTVNGGTVTANSGCSILFGIAHAGSCSGPAGNKFCQPCCNVSSCNAGC